MLKVWPKDSRIFVKRNGTVFIMLADGLKEMTQTFSGGYANIQYEGKTFAVHRIVMDTYGPLAPKGMIRPVVDHIDDNRRNNRADNLQWLSHADNLAKGKRKKSHRYEVSVTLDDGAVVNLPSISAAARLVDCGPDYLIKKLQLAPRCTVKGYEVALAN